MFYFYIGFGILMVVVFFVGICVFIFWCCKDWCEGSFFFINDIYYELRWFYGIFCVSFYFRVNYYGEFVEMDVIVVDFNVDDEFKVGVYFFNRLFVRGCGKLIGIINGDVY